jgi:segregation and condensation protein B
LKAENRKQVVEALIFASDVPISASQIKQYVEELTASQIQKIVDTLNLEYKKTNRAFSIIKVAGGYQIVTRDDYAQWVSQLFQRRRKQKLSQAGLETLSVIVYKQPVSKSEMDAIRGVNCDGVLRTLLERKLITIAGRADGPGRPLLYRTTNEFLRYFGVNTLKDLPKLREIEELLKEENAVPEDAAE